MQAEHQGNVWRKDDRGVITIWDGEKWEWWGSKTRRPQPPPLFVAPEQDPRAERGRGDDSATEESKNHPPGLF